MLYLKRDNVVNQESIHRTGYYVAIPHDKVILCAYEHIVLIVRYRYIRFNQLQADPLHVLTDANVLVLVDTDQKHFC